MPPAVPVTLVAGDAVTGEGACAFLAGRPEVRLLPAARTQEARVVIVIADAVTEDVFRAMERAAAQGAGRFVLVGDGISERQLARAAGCGRVSVLPRRTASFDQLLRAVAELDRTPLTGAVGTSIVTGTTLGGGALAELIDDAARPRGGPVGAAGAAAAAETGADFAAMQERAADDGDTLTAPAHGRPTRRRAVAAHNAASSGSTLAAGAAPGVSPAAARLAEELGAEENAFGGALLDEREVEVFRLLAEGLGTAEIADRLHFSERTIKNTVYGAMTRLNLRNRAHAVAYALRSGAL